MKRIKIKIEGVVQGVGFRPFIFNLAKELELSGFVYNHCGGVTVEVQGNDNIVDRVVTFIKKKAPKASEISKIIFKKMPSLKKESEFVIKKSKQSKDFQDISSDLAICEDCKKEVFNPQDRRYLYPFINCTNCGPRFTIIKNIPYDRKNTSMSKFKMCKTCEEEYKNPLDRRFHAQPISCYKCGPKIWGEDKSGEKIYGNQTLEKAAELISRGKIVALKSLGGFHLMCDFQNKKAVSRLRKFKNRPLKPLALMTNDLGSLSDHLEISSQEKDLLESSQAPIVLLKKKDDCDLCMGVAPGVPRVGVILPYTPAHLLLFDYLKLIFKGKKSVLVCTSGNIGGEPIIIANQKAKEVLSFVDFFVFNNRDIVVGYDDSIVVHNKATGTQILRAARGIAPVSVSLPFQVKKDILAGGSDYKSSFAIAKKNRVVVSQYIGDFETLGIKRRFNNILDVYKKIYRASIKEYVCDLHPYYRSTRSMQAKAQKNKTECLGVQHHKAHVASVIAENNIRGKVIGVTFDGTGFGEDGKIWGGEFFAGTVKKMDRVAHLNYFLLPGGDKASKNPWRVALSLLVDLGMDSKASKILKGVKNEEIDFVKRQIEAKINCFEASSVGRLFDAVSGLLNVSSVSTYEAESAMRLEKIGMDYKKKTGAYKFSYKKSGEHIHIDWIPVIKTILKDAKSKKDLGFIVSKFHNSIAQMIVDVCGKIKKQKNINKVCLSGGVFQNTLIIEETYIRLKKKGFKVYLHKKVPFNDGGISLGQAYIKATEDF